jgi:uncharacterized protein YndB with AHSA1/START domain
MSSPLTHASFTIERKLSVPPSRVFHAFADYETKKKWFGGPAEWVQGESSLDFRVGGRETDVGARRRVRLHHARHLSRHRPG